ncbi:hypothetical protein BD413DRAFT_670341 [Trametes elegans]|nr:hypothetical protein BD413DRAFT_670341 [Trametes elegans]
MLSRFDSSLSISDGNARPNNGNNSHKPATVQRTISRSASEMIKTEYNRFVQLDPVRSGLNREPTISEMVQELSPYGGAYARDDEEEWSEGQLSSRGTTPMSFEHLFNREKSIAPEPTPLAPRVSFSVPIEQWPTVPSLMDAPPPRFCDLPSQPEDPQPHYPIVPVAPQEDPTDTGRAPAELALSDLIHLSPEPESFPYRPREVSRATLRPMSSVRPIGSPRRVVPLRSASERAPNSPTGVRRSSRIQKMMEGKRTDDKISETKRKPSHSSISRRSRRK